jgi:transposase
MKFEERLPFEKISKQMDNQFGNEDWCKVRGYGYRWMAESAFSSLKRIFGEYIISARWKNIVNELLLKASIYNLFIKMNRN